MPLASILARPQFSAAAREGELELPGGRRLTYTLFGATDGPLVVVLDGPGSRGLARAAAASAEQLGLRLVAPDRPGFAGQHAGRRRPHRRVARRSRRAARRARRAGARASSRSPAERPTRSPPRPRLGTRTTALALVAPIGPLDERAMRTSAGAQVRRGAMLGRRAPWLLRLALAAAGRQAAKDPEKAAAKIAADLPPRDAEIMRDPANWEIHQSSTAEIFARPDAIAREIARLARPWNVDLAAIDVPVALWSGDRDDVHPTSHAERIAELLPGRSRRSTSSPAPARSASWRTTARRCASPRSWGSRRRPLTA